MIILLYYKYTYNPHRWRLQSSASSFFLLCVSARGLIFDDRYPLHAVYVHSRKRLNVRFSSIIFWILLCFSGRIPNTHCSNYVYLSVCLSAAFGLCCTANNEIKRFSCNIILSLRCNIITEWGLSCRWIFVSVAHYFACLIK